MASSKHTPADKEMSEESVAHRTRSQYPINQCDRNEHVDMENMLSRMSTKDNYVQKRPAVNEQLCPDSTYKEIDQDELQIGPDDSVSMVGSAYQHDGSMTRVSRGSSSATSSVQKAMVKEYQLEADAVLIRRKNQYEAERQQLQRQMEVEDEKEEIETKIRQMEEEIRIAKERAARAERRRKLKEHEQMLEQRQEELKIDIQLEAAHKVTQMLQQGQRSSVFSKITGSQRSKQTRQSCDVTTWLHSPAKSQPVESQIHEQQTQNVRVHHDMVNSPKPSHETPREFTPIKYEYTVSCEQYPVSEPQYMPDSHGPHSEIKSETHEHYAPLKGHDTFISQRLANESHVQHAASKPNSTVYCHEPVRTMYKQYAASDSQAMVSRHRPVNDKNGQDTALKAQSRVDMQDPMNEMHSENFQLRTQRAVDDHQAHGEAQLQQSGNEPSHIDSQAQEPVNGSCMKYTAQEFNPQTVWDTNPYMTSNVRNTTEVSSNTKNHYLPKKPVLIQKPKAESFNSEIKESDRVTTILDRLVECQREAALPTRKLQFFSGSAMDFVPFMKNFKYAIENKTEDPTRRLEILTQHTTGEAYDLIKNCSMIEPPSLAYQTALKLLYRDYGQSALIATEYKEKASNWPKIMNGDKAALRKFSIFLINLVNTKQGNKDMTGLDSYEFLKIMANKLPLALQQQWIGKVGKLRETQYRSANLQDFENFVGHRSRNENDPHIAGLGYQKRADQEKRLNQTSSKGNKRSAFASKVTETHDETKNKEYRPSKQEKTTTAPCVYCGGKAHTILVCRKFGALEPKVKTEACRSKGLCFGCLTPGHMKKRCRKMEVCATCKGKHPTTLHDPTWTKGSKQDNATQKGKETPQVTTGCAGITTGPKMTVIPVMVKLKASDRHLATYAFIDNGCGAIFATPELTNQLHVRTRNTKLLLKTLNKEEILETPVLQDTLQIGSMDCKTFVELPSVYQKDSIPVDAADAPKQQDLSRWNHLSSIEVPDLHEIQDSIPKVTLMIGTNVPAATTPLETRTGTLGEPYAVRSPLGWLIYGLPGKKVNEASANFCQISSMTNVQGVNDRLEAQMKAYINMEFNERLSDSTLYPSKEDQQFIKIMDENVELKDGHYQLPLPFRSNPVKMPNNESQAYMYVNSLKKRLAKDKDLHEQYKAFMDKLETKGYTERVPPEQIQRNDEKLWYIPHHAVKHPQKQSIRIVFNCPAPYHGRSLNSELLQGPDMTNRLYGILLRWRKEHVAISADIESMFYQVRVPEDDRDMLRYLWYPKGDLSEEPEVYRMKVHVFGAVSSPSCSNYALKKCATTTEDQQIQEAIEQDFYVDDFVKSVDTAEKAVKIAHDLREVLAKGGFNLTKWVSNDRQVMNSIPEGHRAEGAKDLNIHDHLPDQRTLGVLWSVETDTIGFRVKEVEPTPTRRNILSQISRVYDPIGYAAPFILNAKKILQICCKEKLGWDETIPTDQQHQWNNWIQDLPKLEELEIDRCYKPQRFGRITNRQLHHFADASQDGYGIVTYLRLVNEKGDVHTAFVTGKARVAPLKPHTIVKMELTAATTSVKQDTLLKKELKMLIDRTTFWTDSQTVLKYIANPHARYPVFVGNRVAIIHDGSDVPQWKYIPTDINPADCASRGLSAKQLINKTIWLKGPRFLEEPEETWPDFSQTASEEQEIKEPQKETKQVLAHATSTIERADPLKQIIEHYSDWMKLKRVVAWWRRLKEVLLQKSKRHEVRFESSYLTLDEIQQAEIVILQKVQQESFPEELHALKQLVKSEHKDHQNDQSTSNKYKDVNVLDKNKGISASSNLSNLNPQLSGGLLRVGGRLHNACITEDAKHQIILPRHHHVVDLIIRWIHKQCNHQGRNHILSELRQKYWVIKAGVTVKKVVKRCIICKKQNARSNGQMMADLPASRVKAEVSPFTNTGMDYFGPFGIKQGRSLKKRYGVVFTCMSSRAIHIEVAESLDTSSCVNAMRRFIARRGPVKEITSDNGTNLVGANNELRQALQELREEDIQKFATARNIIWKFNVPAASHHGGVWERQVRTIRKILQAMLTEQHLKGARNEEQLTTLLCEVENTINSRPLTLTSDDPDDLNPITPNHLLQFKTPENHPPGKFIEQDQYARRRWRQIQYMADIFWKRWTNEYLPTLQLRQKWLKPQRNLQQGDIVLIVDSNAPRNSWTMGRVQDVNCDKNGLVRSAAIKTKTTTLVRPVTKICLLLEQDN